MFTDTLEMTALEKEELLVEWSRLLKYLHDHPILHSVPVKVDDIFIRFDRFSEAIYEHLIKHCEFSSHENREKFFDEYLIYGEDVQRFVAQFRTGVPVEGLGRCWLQGSYGDLNQAMCEEARSVFGV